LFVLHPIHTEAVTYISGRADPLAAFFSYLSVIFFISHRDYGGLKRSFYYWGSVVFFVLGLLSKEATAILPLLIFLCDYFKGSFSKKGAVKYVPYIAALLIYAVVRHAALIGVHGVFSVKNYLSVADRLLAIPVVILTYIKLLIFPVGLHMERNDVIFEVLGPAFTYKAITAFLLLLAMAIFLWILRRRLKIAAFGVLWFLVALFPMLNIAFPLNALVAEHWLYLPSFGFFLISSATLTWMLGLKSIRLCIVSFIVVLCTLLGILTIRQNYVWRNPIFFYKYTLRYAPLSSRLHTNLGVEYFIRGLYSESEKEHRKALAIEPAGAYTIYHYLDLGAALYMQGKEKEAFEVYAKAIGLSPRFPVTYWHLGNIYFDRNDFKKAAEFYEKAVELMPSNPHYWYSLGQAYGRGGKLGDAKNAYENAIRRYPYYEEAKISLKRIRNQLIDK